MIVALMELEGPLPKVANFLKSITRKKGEANEAVSFVKEGLHELEVLTGHLEHFGLKVQR